jgi:ribosome-binding protein aMBF1 (putative translation factor)
MTERKPQQVAHLKGIIRKNGKSASRITMTIEKVEGQHWGRVKVKHNLYVDKATGIATLERKVKALLLKEESLNDVVFNYVYDLTVFFEEFSFLNQSKIAERSGIHPALIRQYSSGHKFPSADQVKKIETAVRLLGVELSKVKLGASESGY